jgi:uncharacterized protein YabN with tetrapyrrole methylase and pyrophosphatase domain
MIDALEEKIIDWGIAKGILNDANVFDQSWQIAQANKTQEEVDELFDAIGKEDKDEAIDAIGDVFVTLVMQASLWGVSIEECIEQAYNTIIKRTGKIVDGQFVKDE